MTYGKTKKYARKSKKSRLVPLLVLAFALFMVGFLVYYKKYVRVNEVPISSPELVDGINLNPPGEDELTESDNNKVNNIENPRNSVQANSENPVRIQEVFYDTTSGQIIVKTELYGSDWTKCRVSLRNGSVEVSRDAGTIYQQPYSTCEGFAVSDPALVSGQWEIILEANDNLNNIKTSDRVMVSVP